MSGRDKYYNMAKQEGYRARSAYKLAQLDRSADLFTAGDVVVDLGAAPGGWLQIAAEAVDADGLVVGVDRQRIDPLEGYAATVRTVHGDITEPETLDRVREVIRSARPAGTASTNGAETNGGPVDVVLSDMAPEMSGEYELDQARSLHLAEQARSVAVAILAPGGHFVVKLFDGHGVDAFITDLDTEFESVRRLVPDASRKRSSELYVIGKGRLTAPVSSGDELTLDIDATGEEGDGIAHVDGYTVFVPESAPGDTVRVRIEDVKARFGFAKRID